MIGLRRAIEFSRGTRFWEPSNIAMPCNRKPGSRNRAPPQLLRVVGHNKDSLSKVGGSKVRLSKATPFRIIPESGQVSENFSKPKRKVPWDVFQDREFRSNHAKDAGKLGPKMPLVIFPGSLSCQAERLARVTTSDAIDWLQFFGSDGSNIAIAPHLGPSGLQNFIAKRFILDLPAAFPACAFKP